MYKILAQFFKKQETNLAPKKEFVGKLRIELQRRIQTPLHIRPRRSFIMHRYYYALIVITLTFCASGAYYHFFTPPVIGYDRAALITALQNSILIESNQFRYHRLFIEAQQKTIYYHIWTYRDNSRVDIVKQDKAGELFRSRFISSSNNLSCRYGAQKNIHCKKLNKVQQAFFRNTAQYQLLALPSKAIDFSIVQLPHKRIQLQWQTQDQIPYAYAVMQPHSATKTIPQSTTTSSEDKINLNKPAADGYTHSIIISLPIQYDSLYIQLHSGDERSQIIQYNLISTQRTEIEPYTLPVLQDEIILPQVYDTELNAFLREPVELIKQLERDEIKPIEYDSAASINNITVTYALFELTTYYSTQRIAVWYDPAYHKIIKFTRYSATGEELFSVNIEAAETVTKISPTDFFTKDNWQNEIMLK